MSRACKPIHRARLVLHTLEDRLAPAIYTVNAFGDAGAGSGLFGDVRYCVNAAVSGTDVIIFDAVLFASQHVINLSLGQLNVTASVSITGLGSNIITIANTAAQGTTSRLFNISGAGTITVDISGLTLTGGNATSAGGAVTIADESVTFTDVTFAKNKTNTTGGGAIAVTTAGGVLSLQNCTLNANSTGGTTADGGAIRAVAGTAVTINNCTVSNNASARHGGALYGAGGSWTVTNTTLSSNTSANQGGAFYSNGTPGVLLFQNDTFYLNKAADGGAFCLQNCNTQLQVISSTITTNSVTVDAGGIKRFGGTGTIYVESSIISGNSAAGSAGHPDVENNGTTFSFKYCAIGNVAGITSLNDQGGNLPFGSALNLGAFGGNGGPTLSIAPLLGSLLIDAGFTPSSLSFDQRGQPRIVGPASDIGSIEFDATTPTASGSFGSVTTAGGTNYIFTIAYSDDAAISVGTLDGNDIRITGPSGFNILAKYNGVDINSDGTPRTATYRFTPPGGSWDVADNGTYVVSVEPAQVTDTSPIAVLAGPRGTITVQMPTIYTVLNANDSGAGSLREAIVNANANIGQEIVAFDAAFFATPRTIALTTAELSITDSVTISGTATNQLSVINARANSTTSRIFDINGPGIITVSIVNMTISGGNAASSGGAVAIADEIVTFNNCIITGNQTTGTGGGAIAVTASGGNLTVANCVLVGNTAASSTIDGGAIHGLAGSTITVQNCTVSGNTAGRKGGAIYITGNGTPSSLTVINSTISGNTALINDGGAIYFRNTVGAGGVLIRNCTITGNSSASNAGALRFRYIIGTINIQNCTIVGNTARFNGGGIDWATPGTPAPTMNLVSSVIASNVAPLGGSDIANNALQLLNMSNSALGDNNNANVTDQGGNLAPGTPLLLGKLGGNGGSTLTFAPLTGSPLINAGSNPGGVGTDQRGQARQLGGKVDIGAVEIDVNVPTAVVGTLPNVTTNGGATHTFSVVFADDTSINKATLDSNDVRVVGPNGFNKLATFVSVDVNSNGSPRTATYKINAPGGTWDSVDNGLYSVSLEANQVSDLGGTAAIAGFLGTFMVTAPNTFVVTNTSDGIVTGPSQLPGSLRQALFDANSLPGAGLITFDSAGIFAGATTITLSAVAGEFVISDSVTILGTGNSLLTLLNTKTVSTTSHLFNISGAGFINVTISGMTISGGSTNAAGGAMAIADENVTLENCKIENSTTTTTGGGAIAMTTALGRLLLKGCTLQNNSTTGNTADGGAIRAVASTTIIVQDSTISGNTTGDDGGAIYATGAALNIFNSTLSGNVSTSPTFGSGGAIAFTGASFVSGLIVRNSTISGNSAGFTGGGIELFAGTSGVLIVQNSTISNNTADSVGINQGGGGIHCASASKISLESSIVSGNVNALSSDITCAIVDYKTTALGNSAGITTLNDLSGNLMIGADLFLGPLADNGGPTLTHVPGAISPVINFGSNPAALTTDQRGAGFARSIGAGADMGAVEVQTLAIPAKLAASNPFIINNGDVQRSRVTEVKVTFDSIVTFLGAAEAAFTLNRQSDGAAVDLISAVDNSGPGTIVTLTFTSGAVESKSLADGRYTLKVLASGFTNAGFDGDGNGVADGSPMDDFSFASAPTPALPTNIFRIFGDANGDGTVAANDFIQFRLALGGTTPMFDFDNDGAVAASDFIQFRLRFGGSI